jgi:hypothetical protein
MRMNWHYQLLNKHVLMPCCKKQGAALHVVTYCPHSGLHGEGEVGLASVTLTGSRLLKEVCAQMQQ